MRAVLLGAVLLLGGCTAPDQEPGRSAPPHTSPPATTTDETGAAQPREVLAFDADRALRDVQLLAGDIGPRLATSESYDRAADVVTRRLRGLGYVVTRQRFAVPAGSSWGTPVAAGFSSNVVARPPGFRAGSPHRLVGAHLDTVATAPGAEDNASGVAVMLELARLSTSRDAGLPTVFVAFGAEEPVGPGDGLHHFGSRRYVRGMAAAERRALRAMVSLDRVGVGRRVPVCTGPLSPPRVRDGLLAQADRLGVPAFPCELTTSDHWSFEKAGHAVARLGSTPYPAYHSPADLPGVVDGDQLRRTGRVAWAWLRTG